MYHMKSMKPALLLTLSLALSLAESCHGTRTFVPQKDPRTNDKPAFGLAGPPAAAKPSTVGGVQSEKGGALAFANGGAHAFANGGALACKTWGR